MSDKGEPGEEEETHAMGVLEMQEELLRLERQKHETEIAMKSVQPIIQVNLQEIWSQTLRPLQAHGETLVMLHSNILRLTERLDAEVESTAATKADHEQRFKRAEQREEEMGRRVTQTNVRLEQMHDWKEELLQAIEQDRSEREEFQKVTHTRLNDLEGTMQEKLKNFDQRIHDMEYDIERGESKRQTDEKKGMDYRMGFDAKIHTLSEKMLEQVERLNDTNTLSGKLQSLLEENSMKMGKLFMQVVELEGRDLPVTIKKLPAQVEHILEVLQGTESRFSSIQNLQGELLLDFEKVKDGTKSSFSNTNDRVDTVLKEAKQETHETAVRLEGEMSKRMDHWNTQIRENIKEINATQETEHGEFMASIRYLTSPADVIAIIQKYDPLANRDALQETPVTCEDAQAMLETQLAQKSAIMRGLGITNTSELMDAVLQLQKTLIEVSSEGQRLESKVFTLETQLKQDVLDLADEQFQRVDHIMKGLKGSNAKAEATAAEMVKIQGSGMKKEELEAFKDRVRLVEADMRKFSEANVGSEVVKQTVDQMKEDYNKLALNHLNKKDLNDAVTQMHADLTIMQGKVKEKVNKSDLDFIKDSFDVHAKDVMKENMLKTVLDKDNLGSLGPLKMMLEDVLDKMMHNNTLTLEVKAAVVEKADKRLLQMVSEEITNMRNLYDNREDALRTDMVGNFAGVNADMSLKLSEDQVRVVLEQMMRSFQDHFVPKEATNARSINRSPDGAATLDVDQFTQQIQNVQEQVNMVDRAVEKQSKAQTEVINLQLRKVVTELDGLHQRMETYQLLLQEKVSVRQMADMDRILHEMAQILQAPNAAAHPSAVPPPPPGDASAPLTMDGNNPLNRYQPHLGQRGGGPQLSPVPHTAQAAVLGAKLVELWKCLASHSDRTEAGSELPPPYGSSPPGARPRSISPSGIMSEAWRGDSAMDNRTPAGKFSKSFQPAVAGYRPGSPTERALSRERYSHSDHQTPLPALSLTAGQFRPSSPMPPMTFHASKRNIVGEIQRATGVVAASRSSQDPLGGKTKSGNTGYQT